jgi:Glycosyl transferase family 11
LQFEEYFRHREHEIRRDFTFPSLSVDSREIADEIAACAAVSVQVRRGDYVQHRRLSHLDQSYCGRAVTRIAKVVGDGTAFVFSADRAWCRANLRLPCLDKARRCERFQPIERAGATTT